MLALGVWVGVHGVLFTSNRKMQWWFDHAGVVQDHHGEERVELQGDALNLQDILNLTYGHELWVVTERTRS